jgi:hypothetical protein
MSLVAVVLANVWQSKLLTLDRPGNRLLYSWRSAAIGSIRDAQWSRYSSRSLPSATTHRSAPVDDRSGGGGRRDAPHPYYMRSFEPIARCPIDFMPLASGNTSAGRPVVLDTALLPRPFLPPSAKETRCDCLCPDGSSLHGNATNIAARLAAAKPLPIG